VIARPAGSNETVSGYTCKLQQRVSHARPVSRSRSGETSCERERGARNPETAKRKGSATPSLPSPRGSSPPGFTDTCDSCEPRLSLGSLAVSSSRQPVPWYLAVSEAEASPSEGREGRRIGSLRSPRAYFRLVRFFNQNPISEFSRGVYRRLCRTYARIA